MRDLSFHSSILLSLGRSGQDQEETDFGVLPQVCLVNKQCLLLFYFFIGGGYDSVSMSISDLTSVCPSVVSEGRLLLFATVSPHCWMRCPHIRDNHFVMGTPSETRSDLQSDDRLCPDSKVKHAEENTCRMFWMILCDAESLPNIWTCRIYLLNELKKLFFLDWNMVI